MVKQKVVTRVSRHVKSRYDLNFGFALLLHRVLAMFELNSRRFLSVICKSQIFWVKLETYAPVGTWLGSVYLLGIFRTWSGVTDGKQSCLGH